MRASEEDDERFYRDTEHIAFPVLSDDQLATLDLLGTRHKVRRGEIIYKAGQRDVPFNLLLSGQLEVFESRDGDEQIFATPGPRDFVGDIAMLTGTAAVATVRGKAEQSEILQILDPRLRPTLGGDTKSLRRRKSAAGFSWLSAPELSSVRNALNPALQCHGSKKDRDESGFKATFDAAPRKQSSCGAFKHSRSDRNRPSASASLRV